MKGKKAKLSTKISALAFAFASFSHASVADSHAPLTLTSPSGNIKVTVNAENGVSYQVAFNGKQIIILYLKSCIKNARIINPKKQQYQCFSIQVRSRNQN